MDQDRKKLEETIRQQIACENSTTDIRNLRELAERRWEYEDTKWVKMDNRLDKIETEISLYKGSIKFIKALGLTVAALLAFKFGDIKGFWE